MEKYILNGRELTEEEFLQEKQIIDKNKSIQLVEVAPKVYKTRLLD